MSLRTEMDKGVFDTLDDDALVSACADTVMEAYRSAAAEEGEDFHAAVMARLTQGQQALLLFQIYGQHAVGSADDFNWWTVYFVPRKNLWAGIKKAIRFFGGGQAFSLLEPIERQVEERLKPGPDNPHPGADDLYPDPELAALFAASFPELQTQFLALRKTIASFIRKHPGQFVRWEGTCDSKPQ